MNKRARTRRTLQLLALVAGLLLPTLTLVPLGSLWLWQHGLLFYWAIAATLLVVVAYFVQRRMFPERELGEAAARAEPSDAAGQAENRPDLVWTPAEAKAWDDVLALAARTDATRVTSQQAALSLAFETIETVARRIHPEVKEPLWQFTVPEAFAMLERVSARLGTFTYSHIPLSDRLTVAQALAVYRWRGAVESAEKAYDIWRLLRLASPMTAATQEIRERLSKQMLQWGREHVMRQLTDAYVKEVGRAAIDLYGGRLGVGRDNLASHVSGTSRTDLTEVAATVAEPIRIMVAGQLSAGKSSLINALGGEVRAAVDALPTTSRFVPYALERSGLPAALIIDSPGLEPDLAIIDELVQRSADCDLILWVTVANAADRGLDHQAIVSFRSKFATTPNRRRPPMLLVLTHIDRLRPFAEWSPPYDLDDAARPKVASINAAVAAARSDLGFDTGEVIPVSLRPAGEPYNVDRLWLRIVELLPEARRAQLLRQVQNLKTDGRWGRLWSQTVNAGRVIGQSMLR